MARIKPIKVIPEDIGAEQRKVLEIISDMTKFFSKPEEKLSLRGKSNPNSKVFNWIYLRYDIDAIIICYQNFAPAYPGMKETEVYRIIITSYFKGKQTKK